MESMDLEIDPLNNLEAAYKNRILESIQSDFSLTGQKLWSVFIKSQELRLQTTDLALSEFEFQIVELIPYLVQDVDKILNDISSWKFQEQQFAVGIIPRHYSSDIFQPPVEKLFQYLWAFHHEIKEMEFLAMVWWMERIDNWNWINDSTFSETAERIINLITKLLSGTFLVTEQPMTIKIAKLRSTVNNLRVRLLFGKSLFPTSLIDVNAESKIFLINEDQAQILFRERENALQTLEKDAKCQFNFRSKPFLIQQSPNDLQLVEANYDGVELKDIKRRRRENHFVMEEKFFFLFTTTINIFGQPIQIWTTSFPTTMSSHTSQEGFATGVLVWHYANSGPSSGPFNVPVRLPWTNVAIILSAFFKRALELGPDEPGLSNEHLEYLKQKAFSKLELEDVASFIGSNEITFVELTRRKFVVDTVNDKGKLIKTKFSFWDFFYSAIKLLQLHTHKQMWKNHLIAGFDDRCSAEAKLSNKEEGAFLIRFPDRYPGAFSITCYVTHSDGGLMVRSCDPYLTTELKNHSIANEIVKKGKLKIVYPAGILVDENFKELYSPQTTLILNMLDPYSRRSIASF